MPTPAEEIQGYLNQSSPHCLAETFDRRFINSGAVATTTGIFIGTQIWLPAGLSVTNVVVICGTTAGSSSTQYWHALYRGDDTLIAQSTSDATATFPTPANTKVTKALAGGPFRMPYSGLYTIGMSQTASVTMGTFLGLAAPASSIANNDVPIASFTAGSGLGATAQATLGAKTGVVQSLYAFVT